MELQYVNLTKQEILLKDIQKPTDESICIMKEIRTKRKKYMKIDQENSTEKKMPHARFISKQSKVTVLNKTG